MRDKRGRIIPGAEEELKARRDRRNHWREQRQLAELMQGIIPKNPATPEIARLALDVVAKPITGIDLTDPEKECIELIRDTGHRLTTSEILSEWENFHGVEPVESTIKNALASLTKNRGAGPILTNVKRADKYGKGYGLPAWSKV